MCSTAFCTFNNSDYSREWSSRPRQRPDYREYRGGGGGGRDRYSPGRSQEMAPPMKRMRADWDDRPRYGHDYYGGGGGGATSWGPDHYPPPHHGNHHYGNHGNNNRFVFLMLFLIQIFFFSFLFLSFFFFL